MTTTPVPQALLDSAAEREALQRRSLRIVVLCQVFGGAGLAAGITVGALLAGDMLGGDSAAGLPVALFTLGSAVAAYGVGRLSQRAGRRTGLGVGFGVGAAGALGVVLAAVLDSPALLFVSFVAYGSGTATNLQARYAGTDLATPDRRGTAVSTALVATTLGAVAGPNLVGPLGSAAETVGVPALAGPFLLAGAAYAVAGLVLVVLLRPDPSLVAQALAARAPSEPGAVVTTRRVISRGVLVGGSVMVLTQITMVAIMTMTPVHLRDHGHGLGDVGFVIGMHVAAMFLPSLVTGRLVDRVGRIPMAVVSALTLLAAGLLSALAPVDSMLLLTLALMLLGLGWNLGLISGTALIIDGTDPATRARTQGSLDVLVALAGAGGGALSGVVVGAASFGVLGVGGGLLALVLLPVVALSRPRGPSAAAVDRSARTPRPS